MNFRAFLNTVSDTNRTLPLVILYVTEGCNMRCMMCSYRDPLPDELTIAEIADLAAALRLHGLRHIVYSGGEPLLRRDLPAICDLFAQQQIKQSLLTNGLLLHKRLNEIRSYCQEVIVSLDGATAETHDSIRGVDCYDHIIHGIRQTVEDPLIREVSIRTVIQKSNFLQILQMVELAKQLGVNRISFLAADIRSMAFGRERGGSAAPATAIQLDESEIDELRALIRILIQQHGKEFDNGVLSDSPVKLHAIADYYEALLGKVPFPRNTCNAPMVSAVIDSRGNVLPCYFLPSYSNVRHEPIDRALNLASIRAVRRDVRAYSLERCKTCVCTLWVRPTSALFDRF